MKPKIKEILFDAFAVICFLVGFSIHGVSSLVFLLVGSICGAFALFYTLSNNRVHGVTISQSRSWGLCFFAICFFGVIIFWNQFKQTERDARPQAVVVKQPDYIEGTQITHFDLNNFFPFGYAVIWLSENKRLTYEVFKTGLAEWNLDWNKVVIQPTFADGSVQWSIPSFSVILPNQQVTNENISMYFSSEFKTGWVRRGIFGIATNEPTLYVMTLNANQEKPVFAIGFRIPTADENKSNQPH